MRRSLALLLFGCALLLRQLLLPNEASAQDAATSEALAALEKAVIETIGKVEGSVVAIARVRTDGRDQGAELFDVDGGRFGIPDSRSLTEPTSPDFTPQEYATGVAVDASGMIVTTYHVLGDVAKNEYYVWSKQVPYKATVLAADPWLDLAVLKIEGVKLSPIKFGDAKTLKKGQFVIALGNPYSLAKDGKASAKWGIVSNLERPAPPAKPRPRNPTGRETLHHYGSLIETDAILPRGTSGGALVNLAGEMVGLTTSYAARNDVEAPGGLVIPVDQAFKDALEKLKAGRKAEFGFLGVRTRQAGEAEIRPARSGAIVDGVVPGTPAAEVDLEPYASPSDYDIITQVDGEDVTDANHLIMLLSRMPAGKRVRLTVERTDSDHPGRPRVLQKQVTLSKKYMDTLRPIYATVVDPAWRGLTIDYATATPSFTEKPGYLDPDGCLGVLEVERNSAAWKAGLRGGMFLSHVSDTRVTTPAQFAAAVEGKNGAVKLRLTEAVNGSTVVSVPAP